MIFTVIRKETVKMNPGTLYLCATPIGNLEDITMRCVRTLEEVDLIAAEDTRQSVKLLNHYHIQKPLTSYHEHNKVEKTPVLIKKLMEGMNIALVSDAGTPAISDPGEDLARECDLAGIPVTSLPGPSAVIVALTLSGLSTRRFAFEGFLPVDKRERKAVLDELSEETRTFVLYEAPHRLKKTMNELQKNLGGDKRIAICRELTKKFETVIKMTLDEACEYYEQNEPKGEYVLVLEGASRERKQLQEQEQWKELTVEEHMKYYQDQGLDKKEAMKCVAKDRGVSKRDIYAQLLS